MSVLFNEGILDRAITVGARDLRFDGWGICSEATPEEEALLLTIPGFLTPSVAQLEEWAELRAFAAARDGEEGEDPLAEQLIAEARAEALGDEGEEALPHEPWKLTPEQAMERWADLEIAERLNQAVNGEFNRKQLGALLDLESRGRKSKKVLAALDQAMAKARASRNAQQVNQALLAANTPVVEES